MQYKNLDIVFSKKLTSVKPLNQIIHMERITDQGIDMTFDLYVKLIKTFLTSKDFLVKCNDQTLPLQVTDAFNTIRDMTSVTKKDFEDLSSVLKYYNYELFLVGRSDINDSEVNLDENYYWRTYAIENFTDNPIGMSNYYTGYSIIADENSYLYAYNYISLFGLTYNQMEEFDLETSRKSYEFMAANGMLKDFNDNNSLEFLESRGVEYKVLVNIID